MARQQKEAVEKASIADLAEDPEVAEVVAPSVRYAPQIKAEDLPF